MMLYRNGLLPTTMFIITRIIIIIIYLKKNGETNVMG